MEVKNTQLKSIWGKWWEPIRKWFYPTWLIYETSFRFYEYGHAVHAYLIALPHYSASKIVEIGLPTLAVFCGFLTFAVCTLFLTLPASYLLYQFFKQDNLSQSRFEQKLKKLF